MEPLSLTNDLREYFRALVPEGKLKVQALRQALKDLPYPHNIETSFLSLIENVLFFLTSYH